MIYMEYVDTASVRNKETPSVSEVESDLLKNNAPPEGSNFEEIIQDDRSRVLNPLENINQESNRNLNIDNSVASSLTDAAKATGAIKLHNFMQAFIVMPAFFVFTTGIFRSYRLLYGAVSVQFASLLISYKNLTFGDMIEQAKSMFMKVDVPEYNESECQELREINSDENARVGSPINQCFGAEKGDVFSEMHSTCAADVFFADAWLCTKSEELRSAMAAFDSAHDDSVCIFSPPRTSDSLIAAVNHCTFLP